MTARKSEADNSRFAALGSAKAKCKYDKDQAIFSQGEPADAVFYVLKGRIKITVVSEQGREAVVAVLSPDTFFGEGCLAGQPRRTATAVAMSESEVLRLEKSGIVLAFQRDPAFAELFLQHVLVRNIRVEEDLVDQLFNSTEKRLARVLLLLANFGTENEPQPILAKVTQEMLADMIGTTRSHVNRFMNKFRRLGFIDYNGSIEVHRSLLSLVLQDDSSRPPDLE